MKGDEFLGSVISFLILFGIGVVALGILVYTNGLASEGMDNTLTIEVEEVHLPIKYENMLLSYLETTSDTYRIPMKRILAYAAYEGTAEPIIDSNTMITSNNLISDSDAIISNWISDKPYLMTMKINGVETRISGSVSDFRITSLEKINLRRVIVPIFYPKGVTSLTLYIAD